MQVKSSRKIRSIQTPKPTDMLKKYYRYFWNVKPLHPLGIISALLKLMFLHPNSSQTLLEFSSSLVRQDTTITFNHTWHLASGSVSRPLLSFGAKRSGFSHCRQFLLPSKLKLPCAQGVRNSKHGRRCKKHHHSPPGNTSPPFTVAMTRAYVTILWSIFLHKHVGHG